jgi:hypothetical protein
MKFSVYGGGLLLALFVLGEHSWGATLKVKCLQDDGKIFGGDSSNTCKNTLPKCSDVRNTLLQTAFEQLSMKIYGYYQGYDIDLKKTTKESRVGSKMPVQICSVVGHHIRYQGSRDLEFNVRNQGGARPFRGDTQTLNGASCGDAPRIRINTDDRKVLVGFEGSSGNRWSSWMLGAMPYVIRANAYRFSQGFADISKLDGLLDSKVSEALKEEYAQVNQEVETYFKLLPEESRATCENPAYTGMVDSCLKKPGAKEFSLTDPALRICEIVKSQLTLTGGSLSNFVVSEIMEDARAEYDSKIGALLRSDSPGWNELIEAASDGTAWWDCLLSARRKCGAVAISGVMGSGFYKVYENWSAHESDDQGKRNRKGERFIAFRLDKSQPHAVLALETPANGRSRMMAKGGIVYWSLVLETELLKILASKDTYTLRIPVGEAPLTLASGFPGLVEYAIRRQVCGQRSTTDPSALCDETAIPDKPAGVTW